ncbi:putative Leucine-rich repeat (LRR) family protein [Hibiscus syriacus]|uniref:Leucine-rich repeat (LRR) family protein n=1 Tax=Hibiscus syriacus TaxID=106335 RepID=A0A6A3ADA8_HIBSY|nr:putative Leucine-rich repeat (LRR) family protein [Hibiscus syriacus]
MDEAALCAKCDIEVHTANKLASKHQRLLLQCLSNKLPPCDIFQDKAAFIFCVEDRAFFCRDYDERIHHVGSLAANHQKPPNKSAPQTSMKTPQHQHSSFASQWAVDDLLELSDIQSLNKEALAQAEILQLPIPHSNNTKLYRPTKYSMPLKKPRIEIPNDDDEYFMVPDLG